MNDVIYAYMIRIFWAIFLSALLAGGFRAAWNAENGKRGFLYETRENTVVWTDPLVLPGMLILICMLFLVFLPERKMYLLSLFTDLFFFITIYFTFLLFLLPVLRKHFTARACATLWLIPVFLFYQPQVLSSIRTQPPQIVLYIPELLLRLFAGIWLTGVVLISAGYIISHLRYVWILKEGSAPVENEELKEIWEREREKIGYETPVELRYCSRIHTPLTVGMQRRHKITYLPEQRYTVSEAELIFSHELHHIQRNDTHTKLFLKFCCALGWIHPFVWAAVKKAEQDLELSCDEIVLKDADDKKRMEYAELLLTTAGNARGFTTCLSASARTLRYRMRSTLCQNRKWLGSGLLFIVMFLSCFFTGWMSFSTDRQPVSELLRMNGNGIEDMEYVSHYDSSAGGGSGIAIGDAQGLLEYLSGLQADRVIYDNNLLFGRTDEVLSGTISSSEESFYIFGQFMEINNSELYHFTEPIDWEMIRSF